MAKTITEQFEEIIEGICDRYCKYPQESGHEDNPDWLFEDDSPCNTCPLMRL